MKYLIFIISFVLLLPVLQIFSGWVLTVMYIPDLSLVDDNLGKEIAFGNSSSIFLMGALLVATIAYFVSQKLVEN